MKRITVGEVGNINCILYSMPGNMIGTLEKKSRSILSVWFRFSLERADRDDSRRISDCLDEILLSASFHIYFLIS